MEEDWDAPFATVPTSDPHRATPSTGADDWGNDKSENLIKSSTTSGNDDWGNDTVTRTTSLADDDWGSSCSDLSTTQSWNSNRSNGESAGRGGRGGSRRGRSPIVCFNCNEEGHMSRECTNGKS